MVQLSHAYTTTGKLIALTVQTFVGKVISLLFNVLSRFVPCSSSKEHVSFNSYDTTLEVICLFPVCSLVCFYYFSVLCLAVVFLCSPSLKSVKLLEYVALAISLVSGNRRCLFCSLLSSCVSGISVVGNLDRIPAPLRVLCSFYYFCYVVWIILYGLSFSLLISSSTFYDFVSNPLPWHHCGFPVLECPAGLLKIISSSLQGSGPKSFPVLYKNSVWPFFPPKHLKPCYFKACV